MDAKIRLPLALFILRFGLGVFLLLWGLDKLFASESTIGIFSHFYRFNIGPATARAVGVAEVLLSLAFLVGLWRTPIYGLALALHTISTLSTYSQLLAPFGKNHLFLAAIPVWAGFAALFLLRDQDNLFALQPGGQL